MSTIPSADPRFEAETRDGALVVRISGRWKVAPGLASARALAAVVDTTPVGSALRFETDQIESWDSSLVSFVHVLVVAATARGLQVDQTGLPDGVRKLVALASAVAPHVAPHKEQDNAVSARVGNVALRAWDTASDAVGFLGETVQALAAFLRGRARYRRQDLLHAVESTGVSALGIVALINFLIGAVLAFVGAVQLQQFGASIFVADLVAIGVTRELGALMTGIVMAGRTGAAFAAVLGTMTVNEEIDALRTMGLKPVEFLVLPRVLATALMLPALVAYADALGILGGMFVGVTMLDLGAVEYLRQTQASLEPRHVWIGLGKSLAFGTVVALTGCSYGLRCGRSAAAVGEATLKAVVMGIVLVVIVDAMFTVLLHLVHL